MSRFSFQKRNITSSCGNLARLSFEFLYNYLFLPNVGRFYQKIVQFADFLSKLVACNFSWIKRIFVPKSKKQMNTNIWQNNRKMCLPYCDGFW